MIRYENECRDCAVDNYPCLGNTCPNRNVAIYECDECGDEADLYEYDGQQLCIGCIRARLPKVEE